ncbi:MAG: squalene--hopene cyclase [Limisphaerales bacterium]
MTSLLSNPSDLPGPVWEDLACRKRIERVVALAQKHLLGLQEEEGFWVGELMVDVTLVADMLCYHHWNGKVDPIWQAKALNHILSCQLPSGGWSLYYGGPAEVNATIKAYLALRLAGLTENDPRLLKAKEAALALGGIPRLNTFSKLYLALFGLFAWEHLPTIPCEIILMGRWFHVNFHEMSNWTRSMLVPLSIINHYKPTRNLLPTGGLGELYPEGFQEQDLRLPRDPQLFSWRNLFLQLDKLNKLAERFVGLGWHPFRKRALRRSESWMLERFERTQGLAAIFPAMLNSLIALKSMGYHKDHPQVLRAELALKALEHHTDHSLRIEPCFSPVWDTAIASIALHASGIPAEHPALRRAASYLVDKEIRFRGDWAIKNPVDVEPSGWAFEHENQWNPDVDDTAMVLLALRRLQLNPDPITHSSFNRGLNWLITFQCRDGGWAAFDKDCTRSIMEKVPFADHNAMLDPECSDITARVLELLGGEGWAQDHFQIEKAIRYLKDNQEADGSWYGRWGVNYLYGTWQVIRGLDSLGVDMTQPWVERAYQWLESVQHEDGGWGERCDSYEDPRFKGRGPSTPSQTAWVVMALNTLGDPSRPSLRRGVDYLLKKQVEDGSWLEEETTGTGFPKVFYLKYDMYRNTWPLLALAEYRDLAQKCSSQP